MICCGKHFYLGLPPFYIHSVTEMQMYRMECSLARMTIAGFWIVLFENWVARLKIFVELGLLFEGLSSGAH